MSEPATTHADEGQSLKALRRALVLGSHWERAGSSILIQAHRTPLQRMRAIYVEEAAVAVKQLIFREGQT